MTNLGKTQVAVLGTGLMGRAMAERLLAAGYPLTAYNRTREKAQPLIGLGATVVDRPHKAIESGECIILALADDAAIRAALLTPRSRDHLRGKTVIQMGTIGPSQSQLLEAEIFGCGSDYLEAPVLGSVPQIQAGELIVMVGAEPAQYDRWKELLAVFDPEPRFIGPVGSAAALKLALNNLIGSLTTAFSLSLGIVLKEEIPVETFMGILRSSALFAPTFDKKLGRMLARDFRDPNFSARLLLKDMRLVEEEAGLLGLPTFMAEGVAKALERAIELGLGEEDYSAVYNAIHPQT